MSQISAFGIEPGIQPAVETFEQALTWGPAYNLRWLSGIIDANAIDPGSTPATFRLRPGLVLGQKVATGTWTNYSPIATDGSEVASAVLAYGMRMQDVFLGTNQPKYYALIVGGSVIGANLLGLDQMARDQMSGSGRYIFDDQLSGGIWFPFRRFQTKTANYQVTVADAFSIFDNTGAVGEVDFTLPPIANGLMFGFRVVADQTVKIISNEGGNLIAFNNAVANSVAFSTAGNRIGGQFVVFSDPSATHWIVSLDSAGTNVVTVA